MQTTGANDSALEHAVPEQLFSTGENPARAISAVKALQIANGQGIPIYEINQTNISAILPRLQVDSEVKADIQNAVNAGKEVTVPKSNINFQGMSICGYVITDPKTGAGAFMISGGMNGAILLLCSISILCSCAAAFMALAVISSAVWLLYLLLVVILLIIAIIVTFLMTYGLLILDYLLMRDYCGKEAANEYVKCLLHIVAEFLIGQSVEELLPKLLKKIVKWAEIYEAIYQYYKCNKNLALTCRYGY